MDRNPTNVIMRLLAAFIFRRLVAFLLCETTTTFYLTPQAFEKNQEADMDGGNDGDDEHKHIHLRVVFVVQQARQAGWQIETMRGEMERLGMSSGCAESARTFHVTKLVSGWRLDDVALGSDEMKFFMDVNISLV